MPFRAGARHACPPLDTVLAHGISEALQSSRVTRGEPVHESLDQHGLNHVVRPDDYIGLQGPSWRWFGILTAIAAPFAINAEGEHLPRLPWSDCDVVLQETRTVAGLSVPVRERRLMQAPQRARSEATLPQPR